MNDDIKLIQKALNILNKKLGLVETERFISLINQKADFDYTKWRNHFFEDVSLEDLAEKADAYCKINYPEEYNNHDNS